MKKKTVIKIALSLLLLFPVLVFAHFIIFPGETRCILIDFSDFKNRGNFYFHTNDSLKKLVEIKMVKRIAEKKDSAFWNDNAIIDYKLIYCSDEKKFNKYAAPGVLAVTYLKMGAYIVIKDESIDENIIAHELSHTILYRNIGWYKRTFTIPTWFDEGLAMQVDDRDYYSIDSLLAKKNNGLKLPDVAKFKKSSDFFSGNNETIMLNYSTAKYIVHEWLKTHSLKDFINAINLGKDFETAYNGNK